MHGTDYKITYGVCLSVCISACVRVCAHVCVCVRTGLGIEYLENVKGYSLGVNGQPIANGISSLSGQNLVTSIYQILQEKQKTI